jgi:hypothetical protein
MNNPPGARFFRILTVAVSKMKNGQWALTIAN